MGRLIDADKLKAMFRDPECQCDLQTIILGIIDEQSIAYNPERVVEQLENEQKFWEHAYDRDIGKEKARSYAHAIEIVKGGGVDE